MLSKIFQKKHLCYFPWFSQNKNKKTRNVCLHLQTHCIYRRMLPMGQANLCAVISPAQTDAASAVPATCCHNFVCSLIDFLFSLLFILWLNFSFSVQKPAMAYLKANYADCHKDAIIWAFAMIQPHSALNTYHLHLYQNLYVYLYYQSSFSISVFSISHITSVSDSSGYNAESLR